MASTRNSRKSVRRQEDHLAELIGGKRNKASGALPWDKGDAARAGVVRAEAKQTKSKQYIVKLETLEKIRSECSPGEYPLLHFSFVDHLGHVIDSWVAVPEEIWRKHATTKTD